MALKKVEEAEVHPSMAVAAVEEQQNQEQKSCQAGLPFPVFHLFPVPLDQLVAAGHSTDNTSVRRLDTLHKQHTGLVHFGSIERIVQRNLEHLRLLDLRLDSWLKRDSQRLRESQSHRCSHCYRHWDCLCDLRHIVPLVYLQQHNHFRCHSCYCCC